jgi:hypothetical protein
VRQQEENEFQVAVRRLLAQTGHWETGRWSAAAGSRPGTRGDVVYALVQRLADLVAAAENRAPRPVPRLPDMILADQLRVMAADLASAPVSAPALAEATAAVHATAAAL